MELIDVPEKDETESGGVEEMSRVICPCGFSASGYDEDVLAEMLNSHPCVNRKPDNGFPIWSALNMAMVCLTVYLVWINR